MHTDVRITVAVLAMLAAVMDGSGCKKSSPPPNAPANTATPPSYTDYGPENIASTEPSTVVVSNDAGPITTLPAATPLPDATMPLPDLPTEYVVQDGDSFWSIAGKLYHDSNKYKLIQQANPGIGTLRKGMKLRIPPLPPGSTPIYRVPAATPVPVVMGSVQVDTAGGRKHTVKANESGWSIARDYFGDGSKVALIKQANPGVNLDALRPGQVLTIPAGGSVSSGGGTGSTTRPSGATGSASRTPAGDVPHPGMRLK